MTRLEFRLRADADLQGTRLPAGTVVAEVQSRLDAAALRRAFVRGDLDLCIAEGQTAVRPERGSSKRGS